MLKIPNNLNAQLADLNPKDTTADSSPSGSQNDSANKPVIHFVYSGSPDDNSICTPIIITRKVFHFLSRYSNVKHYDWDDKQTSPFVKPNDIILGHPHPDRNTIIWKLFAQRCAKKYLIWPFHSRLPQLNRYAKDLADKAEKLFLVSGPYWTQTISQTEFADWENKIIRLDNAVDSTFFSLKKLTFNPPNERGLFVFSRSGDEKGTQQLFNLLNKTPYPVVIAGHYNEDDLDIIRNRPNTKILGHIDWQDDKTINDILKVCDFSVNMSVSDASPTTLLQTIALGFIPITTPQCGYFYPSFILLSLNDTEHNIITLETAQLKKNEELKALQTENRRLIEDYHNWDRFCRTIYQQIQNDIATESQPLLTQKSPPAQTETTANENKNQPFVKVTENYVEDGMKVEQKSQFGAKINELFEKIRPKKIVETGTYLGTGTTTIIAKALQQLEIEDALFFTIEVNPQYYQKAKNYLLSNHLKVKALNGLSIPRALLPNREQIAQKTLIKNASDDIFVDHSEEKRVELYYNETNFSDVPDNLLYECLKMTDFKPDFVLLDSAGHIGEIEFNYLLENLKGPCYIALDDIYHIKHHNSFKKIQSDPRFEIFVASDEKFGFCIAKFTPARITPAENKQSMNSDLADQLKNAKKLLIVRPDSIGDFVIFSGVLEHLKQLFQNAEISILLQSHIAPLAENCPYIDKVIGFERKKIFTDKPYTEQIRTQIQQQNFDVAFYPVYSREKLGDFLTLNSAAKIKIASIGDDTNIRLEEKLKNDKLYTYLLDADYRPMLETKRNDELLTGLGISPQKNCAPQIWLTNKDLAEAENILEARKIQNPIVICPFGQHDIRNWPVHKWAKLIDNFSDHPILICGTQQNKKLAEQIIELTNHNSLHNLCGKTSLTALAALLEKAKLCICAESTAAHMAAAVGCPHVVITGGGHFKRFLPYSPLTSMVYLPMTCYNCNWICPYSNLETYCITQITVDTVNSAVQHALNTPKHQRSAPSLFEQKTNPDRIPEQIQLVEKPQTQYDYLVTAVVSTYNSEKYIAGCLEDLKNQTIADKLEIIVVDSGSQQNEKKIVSQFQKKFNNIKYLRTEQRETVYKAWNRAIAQARGKYITNANTDDRHIKNALEIMANALDENPQIAVVYSDQVWVDEVDGKIVTEYLTCEHSRYRLLSEDCYVSSNPMWRKSIHDEFGFFDGHLFFISGDWEFWLRVSQKYNFLHIDQKLGIRRFSPECISRSENIASTDIGHLDALLISKCYHYALQTNTLIDHRGINEHPVFANWPQTNLLREKLKAKLAGKKLNLDDYIENITPLCKEVEPKLSIVIDTPELNDVLLNNLIALNNQSEKKFEIIIVITSKNCPKIDNRIARLNICFINLKQNLGRSFARNVALKFAKAPYVAFLNYDAIAHCNFVKNICHHFKTRDILALRGKVLPLVANSAFTPDYYDLGDESIYSLCETETNCAFKKDILLNVGGFDEDLSAYKCQQLAYKIFLSHGENFNSLFYFPDVIVYHDYLTNPSEAFETDLNERIGRKIAIRKSLWQKYSLGFESFLEFMQDGYPKNTENQITDFAKLLNIAVILQEKNPEIALKWARKALDANPHIAKTNYLLGSIYLRLAKLDQAQNALEKALQLLKSAIISPSADQSERELEKHIGGQNCYISCCTKLAQCYMAKGDYQKLRSIYNHMLTNQCINLPADLKNSIEQITAKISASESSIAIKSPAIPLQPHTCETEYIPIVFIHFNDSDFLKYTLAQARFSNPNSKIYLLGNQANDKYDFVEHIDYASHCRSASKFERVYKHLSPNDYKFELMCFLRWFILLDFLRAMKINRCVVLDSDVMVYADLTRQAKQFAQFGMTLICNRSPGCNFITDVGLLQEFCDCLIKSYTDPHSLRQLENFFEPLRGKNLPGVSDMTFFERFKQKYPNRIGEMSPIINTSKYDANINNPGIFEAEQGRIKIYWVNGKPHGKLLGKESLIAFNILHLQGNAKEFITDYFTGKLILPPGAKKWSIAKDDDASRPVSASLNAMPQFRNDAPLPIQPPSEPTPAVAAKLKSCHHASTPDKPLVTAIVSTYNAEEYIAGCLEDLQNQTIADKIEIIVVNSGSQQNEKEIVQQFQKKYNNIKYIETKNRQTVYAAWNLALKQAEGTFITNANTDDRHRRDALEVMADTLTQNPDIALVYGDQILTCTSNDTFENHHGTQMTKKPEYSPQRLLFGCCVGSQPMWRKALHDEFGYFDESLICAGDWDFWLRVSKKHKFRHIPQFMGLYLYNENGIEHSRKIHSLYERYLVGKRYGNPYISVIPLYKHKDNPLVSIIMPAYNAAEHIASAIESALIQNYRNFELIIIDDGSTDNTKEIIAGFNDDKIKYFYQQNAGLAAAKNLGIEKAKGSFVVFLDADDMLTIDFIAKHLLQFVKFPQVDLVYCDDNLIDANDKKIRTIKRYDYSSKNELIKKLFSHGYPLVPFRTCIRKSVFDKIGPFDEQLIIAEDYDMIRRFLKHNLNFNHLPLPLYLRRMTTDSLSRNLSVEKARCHFQVVERFVHTFTCEQLFPDVTWEKIKPDKRQFCLMYLKALNYLNLGRLHLKAKCPIFADVVLAKACDEINNCLEIAPDNKKLKDSLQDCLSARQKCTVTEKQLLCQTA